MKIRKAVFPIGGLGTRFLPATKALPKEMLPVIDKPLIQFVVEEALAAGIEELIFVTGRGKEAVENHFDTAFELERTLCERGKLRVLQEAVKTALPPGMAAYIRQQEPKGLGHAVWCARYLVGDEPFAVLLADDLILGGVVPALSELIEGYSGGNVVAVMEVAREHVSRYGILAHAGREGSLCRAYGIIEKPSPEATLSTTAAIGRYVLSPKIFSYLELQQPGPTGEIQLTDALATMIKAGEALTGVYFSGHRFDCGARDGMVAATLFRAMQEETLALTVKEIFEEFYTKECGS